MGNGGRGVFGIRNNGIEKNGTVFVVLWINPVSARGIRVACLLCGIRERESPS